MEKLLAINEDCGDRIDVGNTMEVLIRGDLCDINIDNPWAGDSESGFGRDASVTLTPSQAHAVGSLLIEWSKSRGFEGA